MVYKCSINPITNQTSCLVTNTWQYVVLAVLWWWLIMVKTCKAKLLFTTELVIFDGLLQLICFFPLWHYSPNLDLGLPPWNSLFHFSLLDFRHLVELLGWVISSLQGPRLYTNIEKHTHTYTRTRARAHTHTHKHPCPEWDSNPWFRLPHKWRQCMP
jgi:hypothetical protein